MGRKRLPQTVESATGPDHGETFPWHHRVSEASETSPVDLMKAKEKQQHADDVAFIEHYYNQQSSKRKRYNENKKERLWSAEERLAMSAEDVNIGPNKTEQPKVEYKSLSSSLLALAKNLDKQVDNNMHQTAHRNTKRMDLSEPFFPIGEHTAPHDRWPEQMIDKCYPKARTSHHSRHLPQLDHQQHWSWHWVDPKPPYGIQLLEDFKRWRANQGWSQRSCSAEPYRRSKWSCSAEPYRNAGLLPWKHGHRRALYIYPS